MAGMVLAAELDAPAGRRSARPTSPSGATEPGLVDTPMRTLARSQPAESFPSAQMFHDFKAGNMLVPPDAPAAEIVRLPRAGRTSPLHRAAIRCQRLRTDLVTGTRC